MSWHIMPCHVISYHAMSCHVTSHHITSHHIISCHIMPYHTISHHIISYHIIISCHAMTCRIMPFRVIWHGSCHVISCTSTCRSLARVELGERPPRRHVDLVAVDPVAPVLARRVRRVDDRVARVHEPRPRRLCGAAARNWRRPVRDPRGGLGGGRPCPVGGRRSCPGLRLSVSFGDGRFQKPDRHHDGRPVRRGERNANHPTHSRTRAPSRSRSARRRARRSPTTRTTIRASRCTSRRSRWRRTGTARTWRAAR